MLIAKSADDDDLYFLLFSTLWRHIFANKPSDILLTRKQNSPDVTMIDTLRKRFCTWSQNVELRHCTHSQNLVTWYGSIKHMNLVDALSCTRSLASLILTFKPIRGRQKWDHFSYQEAYIPFPTQEACQKLVPVLLGNFSSCQLRWWPHGPAYVITTRWEHLILTDVGNTPHELPIFEERS